MEFADELGSLDTAGAGFAGRISRPVQCRLVRGGWDGGLGDVEYGYAARPWRGQFGGFLDGMAHQRLAAFGRFVDVLARMVRPGDVGHGPMCHWRMMNRRLLWCRGRLSEKFAGVRVVALAVDFYVCTHACLFKFWFDFVLRLKCYPAYECC